MPILPTHAGAMGKNAKKKAADPAPATPATGVSAPSLGSFQDFMAGMAHLEERALAPAELPISPQLQ
jgi:hypothetical protein